MDEFAPHHIDELAAVVQRVINGSGEPAGFDAREWTMRWINRPVPALGGARPWTTWRHQKVEHLSRR